MFCGRQIEFITQCDVGETLGRRRAFHGRLRPGPPGADDEVGRQPEEGRHATPLASSRGRPPRRCAWWPSSGSPPSAACPTQIALMLRDPSFDTTDLSSVRAVVMGGGPATPALVREARAAHRRTTGRSLLVHRGRHRVRHGVHRPRRGCRSQRRAAPTGRAAEHRLRRRRAVAPRRDRRGVPRVARGDGGLLAQQRRQRRRVHRRRQRAHRGSRVGSTSRAGCAWPAGVGSATSAAATTCTPWRSRGCWRTIPTWRRWPSSAGPIR